MIRFGASPVAWYLILGLLAVSVGPAVCRAQGNVAGSLELAGVTAPGGGAIPAAPTSVPDRARRTALLLLATQVTSLELDVDQRPLILAAEAFQSALAAPPSPGALPVTLGGAVDRLGGLFSAHRDWIGLAAQRLRPDTARHLAAKARGNGAYAAIPRPEDAGVVVRADPHQPKPLITLGGANADIRAMAMSDLLEQHGAVQVLLSRITTIEELNALARDVRVRFEGRERGVMAVVKWLSATPSPSDQLSRSGNAIRAVVRPPDIEEDDGA